MVIPKKIGNFFYIELSLIFFLGNLKNLYAGMVKKSFFYNENTNEKKSVGKDTGKFKKVGGF